MRSARKTSGQMSRSDPVILSDEAFGSTTIDSIGALIISPKTYLIALM